MALEVWGLDPLYINSHWSDELLTLMFVARTRRYRRTAKTQDPDAAQASAPAPANRISDAELFSVMGVN